MAETNTHKTAEIIQGRDDQQQQFIHQYGLLVPTLFYMTVVLNLPSVVVTNTEDHGRRDSRESRGAGVRRQGGARGRVRV